LERATLALSARLGDLGVQLRIVRGMVLVLRGRFREGREELERAEADLEERHTGWETLYCRFYLILALYALGEGQDMRRRREEFLDDARARGNLLLQGMLCSWAGHIPALMADDPDAGEALVLRGKDLWLQTDGLNRILQAEALSTAELYRREGAGEGAL